jgi:hypothetical protein
MLNSAPALLALHGDAGIDLFRRIDQAEQGRTRYLCVATQATPDTAIDLHEPAQAGTPEERAQALARLAQTPALLQPFALGDSRTHPAFDDPASRMLLLLYHEFFRARAVAAMGLNLFANRLEHAPESALADPGAVIAAVRSIYEFNLLSPTRALRESLACALIVAASPPQTPEQSRQNTAYALRMLGDIALRAGETGTAMTAHDGAVTISDNPHRRRRAIEAAIRAGDQARAAAHLRAFAQKWKLPADLAVLAQGLDARDHGAMT